VDGVDDVGEGRLADVVREAQPGERELRAQVTFGDLVMHALRPQVVDRMGAVDVRPRAEAAAARLDHELKAAGARPRRSALSGVDSLTPAEHRVATLAAQGHSNREIAQQLYVTRRTVETHLTHVFQKRDVATRVELDDALSGTAAAEAIPA
jgi:DNA-binding CsgD family transcriptional regulator